MCGGVKFIFEVTAEGLPLEARVFFGHPHAKIPVRKKRKLRLVQWGRRVNEASSIQVPPTGWARFDNLHSPIWQQFNPEPVLIPVLQFSEKGNLPKSRWFKMPENTYLMGLEIAQPDQPYVYVVTNPAAYGLEDIHPRMPHLVHEDFTPAHIESLETIGEPASVKKRVKPSRIRDTVQQSLFDL